MRRSGAIHVLLVVGFGCAFGATPALSATHVPCSTLASTMLPDTSIVSATEVTGPSFTPPDGQGAVNNLPAFCRVVAVTEPAVNFEVWLPLQNWNGKFQGVGNGGMAGIISYAALGNGLRRGYAVASTDTGHVSRGSFDAAWALNRPDLVADFGHRGLHVMTVNGKAITRSFYGKQPNYSYYVGCSKGGQQGLMEAQRYPTDYDGIIAGDPANNWTRFYAGAHLWYSMATLRDAESYIPPGKMGLIDTATRTACDAIDGVVDGVIDDPRRCDVDSIRLPACPAGQDLPSCFTPKQLTAIHQIWSGVRTSTGQLVYPGLVPGAEGGAGGWAAWTSGTQPFTGLHWLAAEGFFKYLVFNDPTYDPLTFNFDRDLPFALATVGPHVDAVDPDLRALKRRGAKLIVYHGWSDPDISPLDSIDYFEDVVTFFKGRREDRQAARREVNEFFRLFMVPGMQHCSGGPGPNNFDMLTALEDWVERGEAPSRVVASHLTNGVVDRTRPLCVYPRVAVYTGQGSTDDEANFECRNARSGRDDN